MTTYTKQLVLALAASSAALAGSPEAPVVEAPTESTSSWLTPSLNARLRVEARDEQGKDGAVAGTIRVRPGITLGDAKSLSLFAESEHTYAFIDSYDAGNGNDISPQNNDKTGIADPESDEINQLYLNYKTGGFQARVGRQRIILDNAAHIGNVGWRQNEQTYDAATLSYKEGSFSIQYSYLDQVNRIFGSDAEGPLGTLEDGDGGHLLSLSYKASDELKLGAYTYLLDFDQGAWANSDTIGIMADIKNGKDSLHLELATQSGHDTGKNNGALYGHVKWAKPVDGVTYIFGTEYLEEGFRAPLSTAHAFNGFADAFLADRIGLTTLNNSINYWDGQTDVYVGVSTKVKGVVLKGFIHGFWDDSLSDMYGWEIDGVVVKKLRDDLTLVGKAAYFFGNNDSDNNFSEDIAQVSVQLDYKF